MDVLATGFGFALAYLKIFHPGAFEQLVQRQKFGRIELVLQTLIGRLTVHKPGTHHCVSYILRGKTKAAASRAMKLITGEGMWRAGSRTYIFCWCWLLIRKLAVKLFFPECCQLREVFVNTSSDSIRSLDHADNFMLS